MSLQNLSEQCETLYIRIPLQTRLLEYSVVGRGEGHTEYVGHEDGSGTNITMTYGYKGATPTEFTITRNSPINRTIWEVRVDPGAVIPTVLFGGDIPVGP